MIFYLGPRRLWNSNKKLTKFVYVDGQPKSMCWSYFGNYLIWKDCSKVKEEKEVWSVLIPLDSTKEVLVGKLYHEYAFEYGLAEELHSANIQITSKNEDCFLSLEWTRIERKDYVLFLKNNDEGIFLSRYDYLPMCKVNQPKNGTIEEHFQAWESLFREKDIFNYFTYGIKYFKPELSPINLSKVKQKFLTNVKVYSENAQIYANMSHWNGNILPWKTNVISLDENRQLHGTCSFSLLVDHYNKTGTQDFLKWSLRYFSGRFEHGKLQGLASLLTWNGAVIMAMFKDGVLHGPTIAIGKIPIYDLGVRIIPLKCLGLMTYHVNNFFVETWV